VSPRPGTVSSGATPRGRWVGYFGGGYNAAPLKPMTPNKAVYGGDIHVLRKEPKVVSIIFSAIHGRIGILDQGFAVCTVFRENADAEAATNAKGVTLNDEFCDHCTHDPLSGNCYVGDVLYASEQDEEFVSA
jgi:hypothetical protein